MARPCVERVRANICDDRLRGGLPASAVAAQRLADALQLSGASKRRVGVGARVDARAGQRAGRR